MSNIIYHTISKNSERDTIGEFNYMDNNEPVLRYNLNKMTYETYKDQKEISTKFVENDDLINFTKNKIKEIDQSAVIIDIPQIKKENISITKSESWQYISGTISELFVNEINEMTKFENDICQANIVTLYERDFTNDQYLIVNFPIENSFKLYHHNKDNHTENSLNIEHYGTFDNLYDAETYLLDVLTAQSKDKVQFNSSNRYFKTEGLETKLIQNIPLHTLDFLYDTGEGDYTDEEIKEMTEWCEKNNIYIGSEHSDNTYFKAHPEIGNKANDCVDMIFETNYMKDLIKARHGFRFKDVLGEIITAENANLQLTLNTEAVCAEYYNGMSDDPDNYPQLSKKETLKYINEQIYDRLDDGNGTTIYGDDICGYLKLIDDEILEKEILNIAHREGIYNKFNGEEKNFIYITDNFQIKLNENNAETIFNSANADFSHCFDNLGDTQNASYVSDEDTLLNKLKAYNISYEKKERNFENIVLRKITAEESNHTINQEKSKTAGHMILDAEMKEIPEHEQKTLVIYPDKAFEKDGETLYPGLLNSKINSTVTETYIDRYTRALTNKELEEEKNKFYLKNQFDFKIKSDINEPNIIGKGYKVFQLREDGNLYPPMVQNPNGEPTPINKWVTAQIGPKASDSKTGKPRTKTGGPGAGTNSNGTVSLKPGFHIADFPYATNFNHVNPENGKNELFPKDYVYAEVEFSKDKSYQDQAETMHEIPKDGYYKYVTNTMTESKTEWNIAGKMKVNRIVPMEEIIKMQKEKGIEQKFEKDYLDKIKISELQKQLTELEKKFTDYKKNIETTLSKDSKKTAQILNLKTTHNLTNKQQNEIIKTAFNMANNFKKENEKNMQITNNNTKKGARK